jgi:hypothetical protein
MHAAATAVEAPPLSSGGVPLALDTASFGRLVDASQDIRDVAALRARMARDGYLFLPGLLDRDAVLRARHEIVTRLAAAGVLRPDDDPMAAILADGAMLSRETRAGLTANNAPLHELLYQGAMIAFFERVLGEPVRHYDFTWFRAVPPGLGTPVHADVVFMGRAERDRLFTAWTPIGDVDFAQGGLMILENSCHDAGLRQTYFGMDVDAHCENTEDRRDEWQKGTNGWLTRDAAAIRRRMGGRWLTAEYRAGDVLIFSVFTVHASLDNRSGRIRLSADSRYQPASMPADERWIGANPVGHGPGGKRGMIC